MSKVEWICCPICKAKTRNRIREDTEIKNFPPRAMKRITKRTDYIARTTGERNYPWRIWAITEKDTEMPVNNLVYALASPTV